MKNTYHIQANEDLFNKWKLLGLEISELSSIVQNDMEISSDQLREFVEEYNELRHEMQDIMALTLDHIGLFGPSFKNE